MTVPHESKRPEPPPAATNGDSDHREAERSTKKVRRREHDSGGGEAMESPNLSYKSMLASGHGSEEFEDTWEEEAEPEVEEGDIVITETEGGLVMKLSTTFKSKLRKPWDNAKPFRLIDLENDFFIVRFKDKTDALQALLGGPWAVFGHALSVQPWTPDFRAVDGVIEKATVWVRAVKIDERTISMDRGRFAKVAVVVDLTKPLKGVVTVDEEDFKVVYEGVSELCFCCGKIDHLQAVFPERKDEESSPIDASVQNSRSPPTPSPANVVPASTPSTSGTKPVVGEWMVVPPRTKRQSRRFPTATDPGNSQPPHFTGPTNRFSLLSNSFTNQEQTSASTSPHPT
ncbi:hypothetical protein Tsubulata_003151 [Turnera subulata]|uniref:DUF4283 domain-containing protein n=1 Tax=Turnera subulata TaxID=218843 RepID=A0A9Q0JFG6_9ROSI|nr:hypothetical protein Tsubulata_003151 [Turnera subulata]